MPAKATTVLNLRKQQARTGGSSFEGSRPSAMGRPDPHVENSKLDRSNLCYTFPDTPNATEVPPSTPICCESRLGRAP
jgi:hypothetical protein